MGQKYTEARKEGNRRWDAANLDRMSLALPKGSRDTIKAHATETGESVNRFIARAISEAIERDSDGIIATSRTPQDKKPESEFIRPETLQAAKEAAEVAGEDLPQFFDRAVTTQAKRDTLARRLSGGKGTS